MGLQCTLRLQCATQGNTPAKGPGHITAATQRCDAGTKPYSRVLGGYSTGGWHAFKQPELEQTTGNGPSGLEYSHGYCEYSHGKRCAADNLRRTTEP